MSKPSKVKYWPVTRDEFPDVWDLFEEERAHHDETAIARFALVWMYEKKPDRDGVATLGKAVKVQEVYARLIDLDFLILLNRLEWMIFDQHEDGERMKRFLLDHELCHCAADLDEESGDQKEDASGRKLWRLRKHDLEEFEAPIRRHGLCMADVIRFAAAIESAQRTLPFPKRTAA